MLTKFIPKPSPKLAGLQQEIFPTLYLPPGSKIKLVDGKLQLGLQSVSIDLKKLRSIIAIDTPEIEAAALRALLEFQIPVVMFGGNGNFLGRIEPEYQIRNDIIQAQIKLTEQQRVEIMQAAVWGRLRRCRRFLQRSKITEACDRLKPLCNQVYNHDTVLSLQGLLGQATLIFYQALPECLSHDWKFSGRHDNSPVNRMLDFAEKLLEESVKTAIYAVGLNPNLGYWHTNHHNQKGLIADLKSEFNIFPLSCVVRALNQKQITLKDFDNCWYERDLPQNVVKAIALNYEQKMGQIISYPHTDIKCSYQELIYIQAKQLALYFQGKIEKYYSPDLQ